VTTKLKSNDPCWCGSGKKFKRCHRVAPPGGPASGPTVRPGVIGPRRSVPATIARPEYAATGNPRSSRGGAPEIKSPELIERMRRAGRAAADVRDLLEAHIAPGVTTDELDAIVHEAAIERGAYPSPLNYHGYPKSLCTSVNEVICHGIPDNRALQDGDIVNCDVTLFLDGVHGDTSRMFLVGEVDEASRQLVQVTQECMMLGIEAVRPGGRVRDIGKAIEGHALAHGYGVVHAFVGHGIGEEFHGPPHVPHYQDPRARTELKPGMTFTVEPMITMGGNGDHELWDDGWTAVTTDLSRTAQFEHTVLVTERGVEILTLAEGEPQPFPH
jgi:methionyl aminopeptidase